MIYKISFFSLFFSKYIRFHSIAITTWHKTSSFRRATPTPAPALSSTQYLGSSGRPYSRNNHYRRNSNTTNNSRFVSNVANIESPSDNKSITLRTYKISEVHSSLCSRQSQLFQFLCMDQNYRSM